MKKDEGHSRIRRAETAGGECNLRKGSLLPNEAKIIVLVGCLFSPVFARVTYSVARRVAGADFVKARHLQGASQWDIVVGDILPNCLSPIIVQATLLARLSPHSQVRFALSFHG